MADYNTLLKTWGDTGTEYPDGYSLLEGEQPVDAWDNFLRYNTIQDLLHLVELTNSRIESDSGSAGNTPPSPEEGHFYYDTTNDQLKVWNASTLAWETVAMANRLTLKNALNANGYGITSVGSLGMSGTINVNGNNIKDGSDVIYNANAEQFSDADTVDGKHASDLGSGASDSGVEVLATATNFDFGANLSVVDNGDGTVTISADQSGDTHTNISEDGAQVQSDVDDINFIGHLNVISDGDGSVTIDPAHNHDSRYLRVSGDNQMNGPIYANQNPTIEFVCDPRTADPANPVEGQEWIRTDL